ncbi:MAG: glycogen/starch synthase [Candidatus Omnitrophota bacterium]
MKKFFIVLLLSIFALNPILSQAQMITGPVYLPSPGNRVTSSPAFTPALLRGVTIHPDNPLQFDFIVDQGDAGLDNQAFRAESQRMVNYFLAALTVPQKDVWVNLSPVEKDRIIPDSLIKTELGRDLLAQDYILKQLTASLIYPEDDLGKVFWAKVYDQAYQKFGVTEIPVDTFNKVWIVPQQASVVEKGNTVYVVSAHLKIMLESDYLASVETLRATSLQSELTKSPTQELSKQLLREIIVPAIEQEVNEGKNFASLRQIVYAMVLAQWYQDVFKTSILNKLYAGKSKMAGIDLNDPRNKQFIYDQYLDAYKKGVFNYIKEENDRLTQQPLLKKYFSGGFSGAKFQRQSIGFSASGSGAPLRLQRVRVDIKASDMGDHGQKVAALETHEAWNDLDRPIALFEELSQAWVNGSFDQSVMMQFLDKYSAQVDAEAKLYPVEAVWPVLKAFALLSKVQKEEMIKALEKEMRGKKVSFLVEGLFLVNKIFSVLWAQQRTPHLVKRQVYLVAAEIHHWAGGLGPVMKFLGKMLKELGVNAAYIAPWYQNRRENGKTVALDYLENSSVKILNDNYDEFEIDIGDLKDEKKIHRVTVRVAEGLDENGVKVYMPRDVRPDGSSFYTYMLYNYDQEYNNYISKEETMAFINVSIAKFLLREEGRRKKLRPDAEPAVVHSNDGQLAPLQSVTMSWFGRRKVIKDIVWVFTTHTYLNRGENAAYWGIPVFLKHMMGITGRFVNYYRQYKRFGPKDGSLQVNEEHLDHTSGGVGPADAVLSVAGQHRDRVAQMDPATPIKAATNGAAPEEMAYYLRLQLEALKADLNDPTAKEMAEGKKASKGVLNDSRIQRHNGMTLRVDEDALVIGCARRGVDEKSGMQDAFTRRNIYRLIQGILDRRHMELVFQELSDKKNISLDGGKIFDGLLENGFLKKVAQTSEGRYVDTDQEFSVTEGRLYPVSMKELEEYIGKMYPQYNEEVFKLVQRVFQRRKANLPLFLNDQGKGSVNVIRYFAPLESEIERFKEETPDQFSGNFQFVSSFVANEKKMLLSAEDADVKSSWLGANEVTEEDIAANGGIQIGSDEGAIMRQGIRLTRNHPGNVLPAMTEDEYWEAFLTILEMTPEEFAENQRVSYQLGRTVMLAERTASVNALVYEEVLVQREAQAKADDNARSLVIRPLRTDLALTESILKQGRNGVTSSFVFSVQDQGNFAADPENRWNGLRSFIEKKNVLEEIYGENALLGHFQRGDFKDYLLKLFSDIPSGKMLENWLDVLENAPGTQMEKYKRFGLFLEKLEASLEDIIVKLTVNQPKAVFLLNELGGDAMHFSWQDEPTHQILRSERGLRAFVQAFEQMKDNERVMKFHSMGGSSHILNYLHDLMKIDSLTESLYYKITQRLEVFSKISANHVEARIDLTFEVMDIIEHFVDVLEKIADPKREITDGPIDRAQQGGIDLDNIDINREGSLMPGVISDKAVEEMVTQAQGLKGIIVSITPISDVGALLR